MGELFFVNGAGALLAQCVGLCRVIDQCDEQGGYLFFLLAASVS